MTGDQTSPTSASAAPPARGLATLSLVCGILSPCVFGFLATLGDIYLESPQESLGWLLVWTGFLAGGIGGVLGLALGIVAAGRITAAGGKMVNRGTAVAGSILSAGGLALEVILAVFILHVVGETAPETEYSRSMHRLNFLCLAAEGYCAKNAGRLPPPDSWREALKPHLKNLEAAVCNPEDMRDIERGFAMNIHLAGLRINDVPNPHETVLFFESSDSGLSAGDQDQLLPAPRHPAGYLFGFVNGHIESVPPHQKGRLIWNPKR